MLPGFTNLVDLYLGVYLPDLNPNNIYIVKPNGDFTPFTALGPDTLWQSNIQNPLWSQPISKWNTDSQGIQVPAGRYEFYLLVMPTGSTDLNAAYDL